MEDMIFIYRKAGKYKCMNRKEASSQEGEFIITSWEHVATVKASVFIENLLNKNKSIGKML